MKIEEHPGFTRIVFTDGTGVRGKMLFSFEALSGLLGILAGISTIIAALREDMIGLAVFGLLVAIVFGIVFWRYFSRVTSREELLISGQTISIIKVGTGNSLSHEYAAEKIEHLRFTGFTPAVDHPLKTHSFDYLGFQTQQEVINSATTKENFTFEYEGKIIQFGIGVPSWDAASLNEILKKKISGLSIAGLPDDIPEEVWNRS